MEAAFITPVFFTLILGIVEMGLAMNDYLALAHSVRSGARVASASGNDLYSDWGVLTSIERESTAIGRSSIQQVVIYKPAIFGEKPTPECQAGTPVTGVCNVYTAADFARPQSDFGCRAELSLDKYWCPTGRRVQLGFPGSDYVGVWMEIDHKWVTKMFGNTKTLSDSSVIRLEPRTR